MNDYLLGIDLGTSGVKAILLDPEKGPVSQVLIEYHPRHPKPGWAEQEPREWLAAATEAVRHLMEQSEAGPASVVGIGIAGQMHTTVMLDRQGEAFRPAILWLDQRSAAQVKRLEETIGRPQLAEWIANPVFTGMTLASLMWIRDEAPEDWSRLAAVLQPKDYVRFQLIGQLATDCTDASATGLFSVRDRCWCRELLETTGIPMRFLPTVIESTDVAGVLQPDAAKSMGLLAGTPVVCGAGDQEAQAIGNGIIDPGSASCTIGTGGQIFSSTRIFRYDPQLRIHTFCHAAPGCWHWMAAILTAGHALRWFRDQLLDGRMSYTEIADAAETIEPGAEGLLFLPYLAGERTPYMDPNARGVFYGLTLRHTWRHMARAVMEGVVLALNDGLEPLNELGPVDRIVAAGGSTRHSLWQQLQADIFGIPVSVTKRQEATAVGAALLAGVGTGYYPNVDTAFRSLDNPMEREIFPNVENYHYYQQIKGSFQDLYRYQIKVGN